MVHEVVETFGFRTVEVRPHDGFYVNGVPVHLKGSNRHTFWPTTGRATNKAFSISVGSAIAARATAERSGGTFIMRASGIEVRVDSATGRISGLSRTGKAVSLRDGPRLVEGTATLTSIVQRTDGNDIVIEARYDGDLQRVAWGLSPSGWLKLDYSYRARGAHPYIGVTFDYPDCGGIRTAQCTHGVSARRSLVFARHYRHWNQVCNGGAAGAGRLAQFDGRTPGIV